ncbi:MAG: DMT family transporter [Planctomycetes bacterium]|nr:DMT family transporter [Planctomycetota bacterium]
MKSLPRETSGAPAPAWGHIALVIVQFCFGLFPWIGKEAFVAFSPRVIVGWRLVVAAVFFGVIALAIHGRRVLLPPRVLLRIQVCALLGIVLNQLFFLEGLRLSTSTHAGILMASIPVVTTCIAILVRQETLVLRRAIGIVAAFSGTFLLFFGEGFDFGRDTVRGDALMFCNVVLYSIYLVAMKPVLRTTPSLIVVAWVFVSSAWTVPLFANRETWMPRHADSGAWIALAAILAFPTIIAYLFNLFALARVRASTVASYIFLQPVIAAAAGAVFLGERMTAWTMVAGVAILVGLALITIPIRRRRVTGPGTDRDRRTDAPSPSSPAQ